MALWLEGGSVLAIFNHLWMGSYISFRVISIGNRKSSAPVVKDRETRYWSKSAESISSLYQSFVR